MNKNFLELAELTERTIKYKQIMLNDEIDFRNKYIFKAFKSGYRQKYIANALGLSESTIKHIIARMKKNEQ